MSKKMDIVVTIGALVLVLLSTYEAQNHLTDEKYIYAAFWSILAIINIHSLYLGIRSISHDKL